MTERSRLDRSLIEVVAGPGLARLWRAARRRLEGNGGVLSGSPLVLRAIDEIEADALGGLLARSVRPGTDLRVGLERLDEALRASSIEAGLVPVLTALGGPLRDRPAERRAAAAEVESRWARAGSHPAVVGHAGLAAWLERLARTGLVARLAPADQDRLLDRALAVLAGLPADGEPLAQFAARHTGDAHGLDRGQPVGTVVANALAHLAGEPGDPPDAAAWRRRWAGMGVVCDDLSCDVLALNLPVAVKASGRLADWLRASAAAGDPVRLTLRQLADLPDLDPGAVPVFVCENPAVVAAAADRLGAASAPVVCTSGIPDTAVTHLLGHLARAGADLRVHADFDWAGVRIAGTVITRHGAIPWRMRASDYAAAVASSSAPLVGAPALTPWDIALAEALSAGGVAVDEELVLGDLLADLVQGARV